MTPTVDYPYLRAWNELMGSAPEWHLAKARTEHAPADAIYRDSNGEWQRWASVTYDMTIYRMRFILRKYGIELPR